jgi:hypothetical protein
VAKIESYKELAARHRQELYDLIDSVNELYLTDAAREIGMDPRSLRKWAYELGIRFPKRYGKKYTSIRKDKRPGVRSSGVSVQPAPWE